MICSSKVAGECSYISKDDRRFFVARRGNLVAEVEYS